MQLDWYQFNNNEIERIFGQFFWKISVMCAKIGKLILFLFQGTHTAMKTGMLAAESAVADISDGAKPGYVSSRYEHAMKDSWVYKELYVI